MNKLMEELKEQLSSLTHRWSPHPSMADYECVFCGRRAGSNRSEITHEPACLGIKLQIEFNRPEVLDCGCNKADVEEGMGHWGECPTRAPIIAEALAFRKRNPL